MARYVQLPAHMLDGVRVDGISAANRIKGLTAMGHDDVTGYTLLVYGPNKASGEDSNAIEVSQFLPTPLYNMGSASASAADLAAELNRVVWLKVGDRDVQAVLPNGTVIPAKACSNSTLVH